MKHFMTNSYFMATLGSFLAIFFVVGYVWYSILMRFKKG
jgi:hypothetical protein